MIGPIIGSTSLTFMAPPALAAFPVIFMPAAPADRAAINPAQKCRAAIAATERTTHIPDAFLSAIGRVESGRPSGGSVSPWPWTINAAGTGHFYATKGEAVAAARQFLAGGIRSIDVGCLQVNLFYHPDAFPSLEQAFDPAANAAYAATLLLGLFQTTGSWPRAAAGYHSMTPALGQAYQQKVLEAWATPDHPSLDEATAMTLRPAHLQPAPITAAQDPARAAQMAMPPAFGFSQKFMLASPGIALAAGKPLAAYRAVPVQLAWRGTLHP